MIFMKKTKLMNKINLKIKNITSLPVQYSMIQLYTKTCICAQIYTISMCTECKLYTMLFVTSCRSVYQTSVTSQFLCQVYQRKYFLSEDPIYPPPPSLSPLFLYFSFYLSLSISLSLYLIFYNDPFRKHPLSL